MQMIERAMENEKEAKPSDDHEKDDKTAGRILKERKRPKLECKNTLTLRLVT